MLNEVCKVVRACWEEEQQAEQDLEWQRREIARYNAERFGFAPRGSKVESKLQYVFSRTNHV